MCKHVTDETSWALLAPMADSFTYDHCPNFAGQFAGPSSVVHDYKEEGQLAQTELKPDSPGSQPNQRSQLPHGICTDVE